LYAIAVGEGTQGLHGTGVPVIYIPPLGGGEGTVTPKRCQVPVCRVYLLENANNAVVSVAGFFL